MWRFCLSLLTLFLLINPVSVVCQQTEAVKVKAENFENLYKVNDGFYRSEQPSEAGMRELEKRGIKTVLNLRNQMNDRKEASGTTLRLLRLKINTWRMAYRHILEALVLIDHAEKPVVLHCLHGSDRTGVIVAAYRMVHDDWTKEDAIAEFKDARFGYHEGWFPRLLKLLEELSIAELKKDFRLKINKK